MELGLVWMILLPRRFRYGLFFIVTFWEAGVILTANYAFLNYLVLALGILLVDDDFLSRGIAQRWRSRIAARDASNVSESEPAIAKQEPAAGSPAAGAGRTFLGRFYGTGKLAVAAVMLCWVFYASTTRLIWMLAPNAPLPVTPVKLLEPFRVADQYGLFAVMTRGRYEIEFQGSEDGESWIAYPFRYKPQALSNAPGIYAPYQPRLDWNLWFASLGTWRDNAIVPNTEVRLLSNEADVLSLFAGNPFSQAAPKQVRAVLWQYWFTTMQEKRMTGNWWRRQFLGLYAPTLELQPNGKVGVVNMPEEMNPRQ
jgi:hypothetical protein